MGRITIEVEQKLHWKFKGACAARKMKMKDLLLEIIEKEVDENEKSSKREPEND